MRNRWGVLALLFFVRGTMAVQFQSVAAVAPLLGAEFGASLADIGILVGLYSVPGVALALPGGAIGQRFGDKKTVLAGLVLMMAGSCIMAFSSSWSGQISGRLVAGVGSVLMGVLMTKMVAGLVRRQGAFDRHGHLRQLVADRHRNLAACVAADWRGPWRKRGEPRRGRPGRSWRRSSCIVLSFSGGLYWASEIERAPRSSCGDGRGLCGIDLGPLQYRVCNDFQLWSVDAGGARLVDHGSGISNQRCALAVGSFGTSRRFPSRSDRPARSYNGVMLLCNCSAVDGCDTNRRDHHNRHSAWVVERPGGRSDPEFACSRAGA
jgi:Major Facilitator Superfamily